MPVEPDDGDRNPPTGPEGPRHDPVPLDASPVDAVVLRETADGWVDLDGTSYQQSGGRDLPRTTSNTRAFVLDQDGTGLALGGLSGVETNPREPDPVAAFATARRFDHGGPAPAPPPAFEPAETGTTPGDAVRLAIGGHATCLDRCTGGSGQGLTPDVHVGAAITRIKSMIAAGDGPAALLFGGGRASRGGEALDEGGARRYRELTQGTGVPTYVLPGPGDTAGRRRCGVRARPSPTPPHPRGRAPPRRASTRPTVPQPESPPGARRVRVRRARRRGRGARRRDRQRRRQARRRAGRGAGPVDPASLDQARERSRPVGRGRQLALDGARHAKPAEDAAEEIALLAGHASAYVATAGDDDPDSRTSAACWPRASPRRRAAAARCCSPPRSATRRPRASRAASRDRAMRPPVERGAADARRAVDRFDAGTGVAPVNALGGAAGPWAVRST